MMDDFLGLEGYRIQFTTGEGDYEGTIWKINPGEQLLVIKQLIWLPKNTKFELLTFRAYELKSFKLIGLVEKPEAKSTTYTSSSKYVRDSQTHTLLDDLCDGNLSDNELESCAEASSYGELSYELKLPQLLAERLPLDNIVIEKIDDEFSEAIRYIKRQDIIGLSLESPNIGRHEELHWLCISTESCTFLFDIHCLGKSAFINGVKDILENPQIEKVLHDCRLPSDCLFHKFDTRLVNVFDTQVADFIINQQKQRGKDGKLMKLVNPLNSCLAQYLEVPHEYLYYRKQTSYQDKVIHYSLRPIPSNLRDVLIKNVIYLRALKQELDSLLFEPLTKCMNIYLHSLRNKSHLELKLHCLKSNILPDELLTENIHFFRFQHHVDIPKVVSSGPPYRKMESRYQDFVTYCKKYRISEKVLPISENNEPTVNVKIKASNHLNWIKEAHNTTSVTFDNGKMIVKHHSSENSDSDSVNEIYNNLDPAFSSDSSPDDNSKQCEGRSDIHWEKIQSTFENMGHNSGIQAFKVLPAGMEHR